MSRILISCLLLALCCVSAAAIAVPSRTAVQAAPAKIPAPVQTALKQAGLSPRSLGFYVREIGMSLPLVALNEEQPFVLASTTKLVTTLAALDLLGPDYRWRTYAYAQGTLQNGTLHGDLLIFGGGNAYLSSSDMARWFAELQAGGLRHIRGNIVLNHIAFQMDEGDHSDTPQPAVDRPHHVRPDALVLDQGLLRVVVAPQAVTPHVVTPDKRRAAAVRLVPPLANVRLINNVSMRGGCSVGASLKQKKNAAYDEPIQVTVSGSWSAGCGERSVNLALLSHADLTARAIAALWREAGGSLQGRVIERAVEQNTGRAARADNFFPRDASGEPLWPVAVHQSPQLLQVTRNINKTSDNLASRNLLLALTPDFPRHAATLSGARSQVHRWLRTQGLHDGDIEVDNGSGLSRHERGKPRAMVHLLNNAWRGKHADAFMDSLPIAGVDGTLAHRMRKGTATGQAYLKTGTLRDVRALAGYVHARSGKVYAVAAVLNHPQAAAGTAALDALIEWVARNG